MLNSTEQKPIPTLVDVVDEDELRQVEEEGEGKTIQQLNFFFLHVDHIYFTYRSSYQPSDAYFQP